MDFRVVVDGKREIFILSQNDPLKVGDEFIIPGVEGEKFSVESIEFSPEGEDEFPMIIRAK